MEPVIFLEEVDRRGNLQERHRLENFPATIGRGYRNAVILSDRYVSPEHAAIVRDELGALWVEDRSSTNGLFQDGSRVQRAALGPGTRFQVGRTHFRVCTPDQAVDPVIRDEVLPRGWLETLGTRSGALLVFAATVLVTMTNLYLKSYSRVTTLQLLTQALGIMFVVIVWVGAWSLVNRVVAQRFAFLPHLALASVAMIALILLQSGAEYLEFLFAPGRLLRWTETGIKALMLAALLYGHLAIIGAVARARRFVFAAAVSAVIFGFVELNRYADHGWYNPAAERPSQLKPIGAGLLPTVDLDTFLSDARTLKAAVDSLADEE